MPLIGLFAGKEEEPKASEERRPRSWWKHQKAILRTLSKRVNQYVGEDTKAPTRLIKKGGGENTCFKKKKNSKSGCTSAQVLCNMAWGWGPKSSQMLIKRGGVS